jgi:hypothetical protein
MRLTDKETKMDKAIWQIRFVKAYPDAHNHILVGQVVARDAVCVKLLCKAYHFGRVVNRLRDIREGPLSTRIVPWQRIEVVHELPAGFGFRRAWLAADDEGNYVLFDGSFASPILSADDRFIAATEPIAAQHM